MGTLTSSLVLVSRPERRTPVPQQGKSHWPGFQIATEVLDVKHWGAAGAGGHKSTVRDPAITASKRSGCWGCIEGSPEGMPSSWEAGRGVTHLGSHSWGEVGNIPVTHAEAEGAGE